MKYHRDTFAGITMLALKRYFFLEYEYDSNALKAVTFPTLLILQLHIFGISQSDVLEVWIRRWI